MSIKTKLECLEKAVSERVTVVSCPECGETVMSFGDLALKLLAADWLKVTGQPERSPDAVVDHVLSHPHVALAQALLRDLPTFASYDESEAG